jgi:hypothetical protein
LLISLLQAGASLDPNYEEPTVTLSSFRAMPSEGMVPSFEYPRIKISEPGNFSLGDQPGQSDQEF